MSSRTRALVVLAAWIVAMVLSLVVARMLR